MDAVAVGPGLTTSVAPFLRRFLKGLQKPVVVDADALNILAKDGSLLEGLEGPAVLTPHPGEASRLLKRDVPKDREGRLEAAAELADLFGAVVVLKGAGTIVCDGERCYLNRSGNPGMATGGTGDVLTGLLAARLAAGVEPFPAAVQSVFVHGRAGDLAAAAVGENACIATDVVAGLGLTLDGLKQRDRYVLKTARRQRIPVAIVLAGGYAHDVADTVTIHVNTVQAAQEVMAA